MTNTKRVQPSSGGLNTQPRTARVDFCETGANQGEKEQAEPKVFVHGFFFLALCISVLFSLFKCLERETKYK